MINRNRCLLVIIIIVIAVASPAYIDNTFAEENSSRESSELERLDTIRKKHNSDYKTGRYNDSNKDYVKGWLDEDIEYQKKVIKLKSDYRVWAMDKISRKESVDYKEYISLKKYSAAEKEILLEYHKKHFGDKMTKPAAALTAKSAAGKKINSKKSGTGRTKKSIAHTKELTVGRDAASGPEDAVLKTGLAEEIRQFRPFGLFIAVIIIAGYLLINCVFVKKIKNKK